MTLPRNQQDLKDRMDAFNERQKKAREEFFKPIVNRVHRYLLEKEANAMTDTLTKAKELVERFEGKITPCEWGKGFQSCYNASDDESEAIMAIPTMLTIIKELVGMYESQRNWNIRMEADHDVLWSEVSETRGANEKLEQENQALKQRITELEGSK